MQTYTRKNFCYDVFMADSWEFGYNHAKDGKVHMDAMRIFPAYRAGVIDFMEEHVLGKKLEAAPRPESDVSQWGV